MTGQAVFLGKPGFSVSKDCFCFSHRIGLWIKVILSFYFTLMTRNHKSFRDHLCYRFLLWVPNSFGIQGKFLFHTFFTDADRSTSTSSVFEVVWNGEHCKKKKSFLSFLLKIVGTLVLSMLLEKHQDDGPFFFFFKEPVIILTFLFISLGYYLLPEDGNLSSPMTKGTNSQCLAAPCTVPRPGNGEDSFSVTSVQQGTDTWTSWRALSR